VKEPVDLRWLDDLPPVGSHNAETELEIPNDLFDLTFAVSIRGDRPFNTAPWPVKARAALLLISHAPPDDVELIKFAQGMLAGSSLPPMMKPERPGRGHHHAEDEANFLRSKLVLSIYACARSGGSLDAIAETYDIGHELFKKWKRLVPLKLRTQSKAEGQVVTFSGATEPIRVDEAKFVHNEIRRLTRRKVG
jgi:hypothetical protein